MWVKIDDIDPHITIIEFIIHNDTFWKNMFYHHHKTWIRHFNKNQKASLRIYFDWERLWFFMSSSYSDCFNLLISKLTTSRFGDYGLNDSRQTWKLLYIDSNASTLADNNPHIKIIQHETFIFVVFFILCIVKFLFLMLVDNNTKNFYLFFC